MDAKLLTDSKFWDDPKAVALGDFSGDLSSISSLDGHVLFQSSGSTGNPKWIALSKEALQISARAVNQHLEVNGRACWGLALPLHHVGGFGVVARAYEARCRCVQLQAAWNPLEFTQWLHVNDVSHTSLVPTQVHDLVKTSQRAPQTLRAVVVGGGQLDRITGQAARALGWPVLASYGMTEAGSQIATQGMDALAGDYRPSPIPLLPHWKVENSADDRLKIAGAALFSGHLLLFDGAWHFDKRLGDWFETNDRVTLSGRELTPLGRTDLQVKVLGELVDLEAIEQTIIDSSRGLLKQGDFIVVAVPDARAEHALVPVFDAAFTTEQITSCLEAYRSVAMGFQRLREAVILSQLPRSSMGKPRRSDCLQQVLQNYR